MLYLILKQAAPLEAPAFKATVAQLNQAIAGVGNVSEAALALKRQAQAAVQVLSQRTLSEAQLTAMAMSLIDGGPGGSYSDYAGAEQASMALSSVVNMLNQQGKLKSAVAINRGLANLRATLLLDEKYKPLAFQSSLQSFRNLLVSGLEKPSASMDRRKE
jgi:hypothetical protein